MRKIHIVTALSRLNLIEKLISHYKEMNIIWHPILLYDEYLLIDKFILENNSWIIPYIIFELSNNENSFRIGYLKKNLFIENNLHVDEDYYWILDDDDMVEKETVDYIRNLDDDVIFISLKRGDNIPDGVPPLRRYPIFQLIASPENIYIGNVSQQQYIVKGKIFKMLKFDIDNHAADGVVAVWLKSNFAVRYEPQLYALFNYFEKGRWNINK